MRMMKLGLVTAVLAIAAMPSFATLLSNDQIYTLRDARTQLRMRMVEARELATRVRESCRSLEKSALQEVDTYADSHVDTHVLAQGVVPQELSSSMSKLVDCAVLVQMANSIKTQMSSVEDSISVLLKAKTFESQDGSEVTALQEQTATALSRVDTLRDAAASMR